MIIDSLEEISFPNFFFKLKDFYGLQSASLKLEGLNIAGSIKIKTAAFLIKGLEKEGRITPEKNTIIESSSGNLGIALSIICKQKGYRFICVVDPNISLKSETYMNLYGAKVVKVTKKDASGGYLSTRIEYIKTALQNDSNLVWPNQYANVDNPLAHYNQTSKEILDEFPNIDYIFIGAGTTGTLMGCINFFRKFSPNTKIIAVDAEGSVTFGNPPLPRYIPGIGTSRKPEILDADIVQNVITVNERDAVLMCHSMLEKYGLFLGGSTGSVLHALKVYRPYINDNDQIVAISPDFGEKYLETIYNAEWVKRTLNLDIKKEGLK